MVPIAVMPAMPPPPEIPTVVIVVPTRSTRAGAVVAIVVVTYGVKQPRAVASASATEVSNGCSRSRGRHGTKRRCGAQEHKKQLMVHF
jgi:hypothetical protein